MTIKGILRFAGSAVLLSALCALSALAQAPKTEPKKDAAPRKTYVDALKYPKLNPIVQPQVARETLPNGVKLILIEDHELPVISMRALVKGGKVAEPRGKTGLCDLFSEVHRTGGVKSMTGDQVDDFLEGMGASIETNVTDAFGSVSAKMLSDQADKVLPLFAEFLTSPAFSQDKVDLGKTHLYSAISRRNDEVMNIAVREFLKKVYGEKSPYARQIEYDDVDALTRDDLVAFHDAFYRPDATILAVWGDFKTPEMEKKLAAVLGAWKAEGPAPAINPPFIFPQEPSINYAEKTDLEQTTILLGQQGLRLDDPDYPAINLMSDILGSGFSSRIFTQVRTLKGLAYGAGGAMVPAYDHPGAFYFYTATKPNTTAEALSTILGEIKKIRQEPVTGEEISRAKEAYLNSYAFEFDSTEKIANRLALYAFYGYPADFNVKLRNAVEKVTKEDILRAAQKHLNPGLLSVVAVGVASKFDKPLSTFGPVTTLDITIPEPKPKEVIPDATPEALKAGTDALVRAAKALGEQALRSLKDVTSEGTSTVHTPMGEMEIKGKALFVLPDRLVNQLTTPMGPMTQVLDGDKGWMAMGPMTRDVPASALAEMKRGLYGEAGCALLLKGVLEGKVQGQLIGRTSFEGKDADDVLVRLPDGALRVYVAPDGMILGTKQRAQTQEGPAEVVETFGAYTAVSGLKVPFETVQKVKGEVKASSKLSSVKVNAGFSEELFKRPETTKDEK
jgi:zinc protease